jgi:Fusaric acid resistance protein-like
VRNIAWSWSNALMGGLCTVPAATVVALGDPKKGLAWAIGVLPAAVIGVLPTRKDRLKTSFVGVLFAVSIVLGSILAHNTVLAVAGMFVLPLGAAMLAAERPLGLIALTLCAPIVAVGLSYTDVRETLGIGLLMIGGSALAALLTCLFWPETAPATRTRAPLMSKRRALEYGIRLGLAAAVATAIGLAIHTDHVGWIAGATLFVMRPTADMQQLRSWGRVASVVVGALAAVALLHYQPSDSVLAATTLVALAGVAATHGSRLYVTPFFSTFLVIQLLLVSNYSAAVAHWRFWERVGLTVAGVGIAYLFGLLLPRLPAWKRLIELKENTNVPASLIPEPTLEEPGPDR